MFGIFAAASCLVSVPNNVMLMFGFDSVLVSAGCRFAGPGGCSPSC